MEKGKYRKNKEKAYGFKSTSLLEYQSKLILTLGISVPDIAFIVYGCAHSLLGLSGCVQITDSGHKYIFIYPH